MATVFLTVLLQMQMHLQQSPSIEADSSGVTINIPDGTNVSTKWGDRGESVPLVSLNAMTDALLGLEADMSIVTDQRIFQAMQEVRANITMMQAVDANYESRITELETRLSVAESTTADALLQLSNGISDLEGNVTLVCPEYPSVTNGNVGGSGPAAVGAVRVIECDVGYHVSSAHGIARSVVCSADGSWSDNTATRCVAVTSAPTNAPTQTPETVTCCGTFDNIMFTAYADGQRLAINGNLVAWEAVKQFSFPSTTQTLGLYGMDAESGCNNGFALFVCSTPSRVGRWNIATGDVNNRPWRIRTSKGDPQASFGLQGQVAQWAQAAYNNSLTQNGFQVPAATSHGGSIKQAISRIATCRVQNHHEVIQSWQAICGGNATEARTYWWLRVQP